jgi:hypothetical protein
VRINGQRRVTVACPSPSIGARAVVVLVILVVMLLGSIVSMFVVPPFLFRIKDSGEVNFFGIKFLGK